MKSIFWMPVGSNAVPQPGESGSVGPLAPALIVQKLRKEDGRRARPEAAEREPDGGLRVRRVADAGARRPLVVLVGGLGVERIRAVGADVVRVQDRVVRIVEALVPDPGRHRHLRRDEPLVLDVEGELFLGEGRFSGLVGRQAAESAELKVLGPLSREQVRLVVAGEDVDAAPVAFEDLVDRGLVELGARLDDVILREIGHGVAEGDPVRLRGDRQEGHAAEAEAAVADLGKIRRDGGARRLLDDVLTDQVIEQARTVLAGPGAHVGVRLQALDPVVAARPVLGIRSPVVSLVLAVIEPRHDALGGGELVVEAAEDDAPVRRLNVGRSRRPGGVLREDVRIEDHGVDRDADALLLLVVGAEEEEVVLHDRAPGRSSVLLLLGVRRLERDGPGRAAVGDGELGDRAVRLGVIEARPVEGVRAALGDQVDHAAARRPELDGRAVADDGELLDRLLGDRQRRAAFRGPEGASEKPVVEVHAVQRRVGVDAALPGDEDRSPTFGVLACFRRQEDEVLVVAPVDREVFQLLRLDRGGCRGVRHLDGRQRARDRDRFRRAQRQLEIHGRRGPDVEPDFGPHAGPEAGERRRHRVFAGRQVDDLVETVCPARCHGRQTRLEVFRLDGRARQRASVDVPDRAGDPACRDVGLRERGNREREGQEGDPDRQCPPSGEQGSTHRTSPYSNQKGRTKAFRHCRVIGRNLHEVAARRE